MHLGFIFLSALLLMSTLNDYLEFALLPFAMTRQLNSAPLQTESTASLTRIDHRPGEKPTECFFRFGGITVWRPADN